MGTAPFWKCATTNYRMRYQNMFFASNSFCLFLKGGQENVKQNLKSA
jgi:hypothetical protein